MKQDSIFLAREGDAWFQRNRGALNAEGSVDWPMRVLDLLGDTDSIAEVAELGCANGYRLHKLRARLPRAQRFAGVDASAHAIADGLERFRDIELIRASLSSVPWHEPFDLVIVNFVLHWIDRSTLAQSIAEIDRLVRDGGTLILGDFLPDYAQRRRYHHEREHQVYTYKQDYAEVFAAPGTYKELVRMCFDHDHPSGSAQASDSDARGACVALRKSLNGYYLERA